MHRDPTPLCDATANEAEADWLACDRHKHLTVNASDAAVVASITNIVEVTGKMA